ncbi:hypothetical protein [Zavarzinella formosa]|uniref:hypothetical protein n=1 Tax=Zavarzinella formosa TaxID=360055 RepID=UPI0002E25510|nr:hypothetical protein [Zavarzinella formosa]
MKLFGVKGLAAAALVFSMAVLVGGGDTVAQDKKEAKKELPKKIETIKHVMAAQNQLKGAVPKAIKAGDWDTVKKQATDWVAAAEVMAGQKPKKGDEASWKELTDKYTAETKKLLAAAEKKDTDAATAAIAYLSDGKGTCGGCHSKHK